MVEDIADVVADAVFKVFLAFEVCVFEGAGPQCAANFVPVVVVLSYAESKVPFETRTLVFVTENAGEVEMIVEDFSRQYLRAGSFCAQP